jgi:hypothetical protein
MEGIRIAGTLGLYRDAAESLVINDNGRDVPVKAGDRVFVSFVSSVVSRLSMIPLIYFTGWRLQGSEGLPQSG